MTSPHNLSGDEVEIEESISSRLVEVDEVEEDMMIDEDVSASLTLGDQSSGPTTNGLSNNDSKNNNKMDSEDLALFMGDEFQSLNDEKNLVTSSGDFSLETSAVIRPHSSVGIVPPIDIASFPKIDNSLESVPGNSTVSPMNPAISSGQNSINGATSLEVANGEDDDDYDYEEDFEVNC